MPQTDAHWQYSTRSEIETHRLGERLGGRLCAGDVVLLSGELGAGKSVLARGIARGMGVTGAVPSPTFTLMTVHRAARCPLYHMDLYRLEDEYALWESGLEEYIGGEGVALIEWPERAMEAMPQRRLEIRLEYGVDAENALPDDSMDGQEDQAAQYRMVTLRACGGYPAQMLCGLEMGEETP